MMIQKSEIFAKLKKKKKKKCKIMFQNSVRNIKMRSYKHKNNAYPDLRSKNLWLLNYLSKKGRIYLFLYRDSLYFSQ